MAVYSMASSNIEQDITLLVTYPHPAYDYDFSKAVTDEDEFLWGYSSFDAALSPLGSNVDCPNQGHHICEQCSILKNIRSDVMHV